MEIKLYQAWKWYLKEQILWAEERGVTKVELMLVDIERMTWTKIISDLAKKQVNIALVPLIIQDNRCPCLGHITLKW